MDGVTKSIEEYLNNTLGKVGEVSNQAIIEEVDKSAHEVLIQLEKTVPRRTGKLASSLKKSRVTAKREYYGWFIEFSGETKDGTPNEKIANILNYGTRDGRIIPTRFINKAIKKLKKLDKNINKNYESKMAKIDK